MTPTTWTPCAIAHRKTSRPIRPNPLIPILTSDEEDIFTSKERASLDYDIREEKIREEIQLGQQTYKDRRGGNYFCVRYK